MSRLIHSVYVMRMQYGEISNYVLSQPFNYLNRHFILTNRKYHVLEAHIISL